MQVVEKKNYKVSNKKFSSALRMPIMRNKHIVRSKQKFTKYNLIKVGYKKFNMLKEFYIINDTVKKYDKKISSLVCIIKRFSKIIKRLRFELYCNKPKNLNTKYNRRSRLINAVNKVKTVKRIVKKSLLKCKQDKSLFIKDVLKKLKYVKSTQIKSNDYNYIHKKSQRLDAYKKYVKKDIDYNIYRKLNFKEILNKLTYVNNILEKLKKDLGFEENNDIFKKKENFKIYLKELKIYLNHERLVKLKDFERSSRLKTLEESLQKFNDCEKLIKILHSILHIKLIKKLCDLKKTHSKKKLYLYKKKYMFIIKSLNPKVRREIPTPTSIIIKKERVLENTINYFQLFKKFIGHLIKKGKKRKAYLVFKDTFDVLFHTYKQRYPILLLLLAIVRHKRVFQLQRYKRKSREIIFVRTLSIKNRYTYSLLDIMRYGWLNVPLYKNVVVSMANSIIEHALGFRRVDVREIHELASKNKYNFFKKFRKYRAKKVRKQGRRLNIKSRALKIVNYKLKQKPERKTRLDR